jgi:hypothetical protein
MALVNIAVKSHVLDSSREDLRTSCGEMDRKWEFLLMLLLFLFTMKLNGPL